MGAKKSDSLRATHKYIWIEWERKERANEGGQGGPLIVGKDTPPSAKGVHRPVWKRKHGRTGKRCSLCSPPLMFSFRKGSADLHKDEKSMWLVIERANQKDQKLTELVGNSKSWTAEKSSKASTQNGQNWRWTVEGKSEKTTPPLTGILASGGPEVGGSP